MQIDFLEVVGDLGSGHSSTHSTGDQTARLLLVCVWKDGGSSLSSPGYWCLALPPLLERILQLLTQYCLVPSLQRKPSDRSLCQT